MKKLITISFSLYEDQWETVEATIDQEIEAEEDNVAADEGRIEILKEFSRRIYIKCALARRKDETKTNLHRGSSL